MKVVMIILHLIWLVLMVSAAAYGCAAGKAAQILPALLAGCEEAIGLTLRLGAGYLLFCGLIEIAKAVRVPEMLEKAIRPFLHWLMPGICRAQTREAVALNLSMNMLGIGNAATPLGIEAVKRIEAEAREKPQTRHDLYMLLILNATSLQLIPTTVLALRAAAGSADANAVLLPTLLCTALSSAVGVGTAMIWRKARGRKG